MQEKQASICTSSKIIAIIFERAPVLARELSDALASRCGTVEEIRLRANAPSSYRIQGRDYLLTSRTDVKTLSAILDILTEGSIYAYHDSLKEGYISINGGVRVSVVGMPAALGNITALVFRIPVSVFGRGVEIYSAWRALGKCGTLIISAPGGGKTTALRALAAHMGSGSDRHRVVVVDSRCEFVPSDYSSACVDIITAHTRHAGIEMAVRTLSPEIIMCDEIFCESDKDALMGAVGAGVTVIATAHGTCIQEVRKRPFIDSLFRLGIFSAVISIERRDGNFIYTAEGVSNAHGRCYTDTFCVSFDR